MTSRRIDLPPALIRLEAVSRSFGPVKAVDGVSFDVRAGEVHALCGHNGAGKSTVVKLLFGLLQPDAGAIFVDGRPVELASPQVAQASGNALVDQELSVVPSLPVLDNLLLGRPGEPLVRRRRCAAAWGRRLLDAVGLTGVDPSDYAEDLPIAERQLVEIARALGREARVLILDEPTATLSGAEIEHVFAAVRRFIADGRAVIYVSHRLGEVMELCDRVTVLRNGRHVGTAPTSDLTIPALVEMMLGESHSPQAPPPAVDERRAAGADLTVAELHVGTVTRGFEVTASAGRVYGLAGQVGSGASDVLRALAGLAPDARGAVDVGGRRVLLGRPRAAAAAGVAYVSNDRKGEGLFLGQSVASNLVSTRLPALGRLGVVGRAEERACAQRLATKLGIDAGRLGEAVGRLSGGNQQKVLLGRCLDRPDTRVLLLDEPTRGVDVGGRAEIHQLIRAAAREAVVVLFASTELEEIIELADVVLTMRSGEVVSRREGEQIDARQILVDMTHTQVAAIA